MLSTRSILNVPDLRSCKSNEECYICVYHIHCVWAKPFARNWDTHVHFANSTAMSIAETVAYCRLKCTLTMRRNVRTRKFTVNGRKNRAQHREVQLIATNPYCSMFLLNVPQRRLCDTVMNRACHRFFFSFCGWTDMDRGRA